MKNTVIFFLLLSLLSSCKDRYEIENIEFSTTMCFGICPVFEIKIDSNRNAEFHAEMYNFSEIIPDFSNNKDGEGKFRTKISDDKYKKLISSINKLNIEDLEDKYSCNRTDMQTVNLKITYDGGKVKNIQDYGAMGSKKLIKVYIQLFDLRKTQNWIKVN